jgi:hypothetical protein
LVSLRDCSRSIDWLYTRAALPGLIDSWILAGEYLDTHWNRAVVIPSTYTRTSPQSDIVLIQPIPPTAFDAIVGAPSSASQQ